MQGGREQGAVRAGRGQSCAIRAALALAGVALFAACGNDPYPPSDATAKVVYGSFVDAPKGLDPATAYSQREQPSPGPSSTRCSNTTS